MNRTIWMWRRAWALVDRAEHLQRQVFEPGEPGPPLREPVWEPPVDVYQTPEGLEVVVALPGVDAASLDVRVEGRSLVVSGRCGRAPRPGSRVLRMELPRGCFQRRVRLPLAGLEVTALELVNGCLTLSLQQPADRGTP